MSGIQNQPVLKDFNFPTRPTEASVCLLKYNKSLEKQFGLLFSLKTKILMKLK